MVLTAFRGAKGKVRSLRGSVKYLPFLGHSTFVFKEKEIMYAVMARKKSLKRN